MTWQWPSANKIAHGLGWLIVVGIPTTIAAQVITELFADPDLLPRDWLVPSTQYTISIVVEAVAVTSVMVAAVVVWITGIRKGWSLKWPAMVLLLGLLPYGAAATCVIGGIGIGKLIIWWVGRGSVVSASRLREPVAVSPPVGLVEFARHE